LLPDPGTRGGHPLPRCCRRCSGAGGGRWPARARLLPPRPGRCRRRCERVRNARAATHGQAPPGAQGPRALAWRHPPMGSRPRHRRSCRRCCPRLWRPAPCLCLPRLLSLGCCCAVAGRILSVGGCPLLAAAAVLEVSSVAVECPAAPQSSVLPVRQVLAPVDIGQYTGARRHTRPLIASSGGQLQPRRGPAAPSHLRARSTAALHPLDIIKHL
jgi:hypothetical protein